MSNTFETKAREAILNFLAARKHQFKTEEEDIGNAITALSKAHEEECLMVIGEDDSYPKLPTTQVAEQKNYDGKIRNRLRVEQRNRLLNKGGSDDQD